MYRKFVKRGMDILVSAGAILSLMPIFIITAIVVRIKLGSPILFVQERPGKNEKIFKMLKFRTMTDAKDKNGHLLSDAERLTKVGEILRSTSLDELPELFNIIKGDMSIVGPRPLLVQYLSLYNEEQKKRHLVRPGLTGLAQVNGRNAISWEKKFEYDIEYVNQFDFWMDVSIIFKTIKSVFTRNGISSKTSVTMEPFQGSGIKEESRK